MRKSCTKKNDAKWYKFGLLILLILVISSSTIIWNKISYEVKTNSNIVAKRLTDDRLRHGPIEFNGKVYFPSSYTFPEERNTDVLGDIVPKDASTLTLLIMNDQIVADKDDQYYTHLKTQGDDFTRFTKASFLEDPILVRENLMNYSKFVLCNDDNVKDIRITINSKMVNKLEENFGKIEYNINDFNKCGNIYYLYVDKATNDNMNSTLEIFDDPIIYIGCIFVVDEKLYYGNLNNSIEGELYDELIDILGI
ncbi:MAG: hypothetical protein ACOWWH_13910 [Eubacteriaceae bacterium]